MIAAALLFSFWYGGNVPGARGWKIAAAPSNSAETQTESAAASEAEVTARTPADSAAVPTADPAKAASSAASEETADSAAEASTAVPTKNPTAVPTKNPTAAPTKNPTAVPTEAPTEVPTAAPTKAPTKVPTKAPAKTPTAAPAKTPVPEKTCTVSISCRTVLDNLSSCDPAKASLVPADGTILGSTSVSFSEGESVFDVLQHICKKNGIQMEAKYTPVYSSSYVEGISNLYEFDVGENSGWMYRVNGWFPNYGCSRYAVKDGDVIEWLYSCNLGADVGGSNTVG